MGKENATGWGVVAGIGMDRADYASAQGSAALKGKAGNDRVK